MNVRYALACRDYPELNHKVTTTLNETSNRFASCLCDFVVQLCIVTTPTISLRYE